MGIVGVKKEVITKTSETPFRNLSNIPSPPPLPLIVNRIFYAHDKCILAKRDIDRPAVSIRVFGKLSNMKLKR